MISIEYLDEIQIELENIDVGIIRELSCLPFIIFDIRELKFYLELDYEPELNSLLEQLRVKYKLIIARC